MSSSLDDTLPMVVTIVDSDKEIWETELWKDEETNYYTDILLSPENYKTEDESSGSSVMVIF